MTLAPALGSVPASHWLLDIFLVVLLVGLAVRMLTTRDFFEAVVLFVAYGLTLALTWVRVGAVDLALAEAALGAGVTGALFLNAYRRLSVRLSRGNAPLVDDGTRDGPLWLQGGLAVGGLMAASAVGWILFSAPERDPLLPVLVRDTLGQAGVENPVTAVLLNFRSYDTLLEVAVLMVAMTAVWSMDRGSRPMARDDAATLNDPTLALLARLVVPLAGMVAVYLTWVGSKAPGGAFQAGALLAGAGVLLSAAGLLTPPSAESRWVRGGVAFAIYLFVAVGFGVMPWTGHFLHYPEGWAYPLILMVEGVLTVAIAVALVELFVDVPAVPDPDPALDRLDPTGDPLGRLLDPGGRPGAPTARGGPE